MADKSLGELEGNEQSSRKCSAPINLSRFKCKGDLPQQARSRNLSAIARPLVDRLRQSSMKTA